MVLDRRFACALALVLTIFCGGAAAQAPATSDSTQAVPAQLPAFDVVSIKPHKDEGMMMRVGISDTPDGFAASGLPLRMLIRQAFGLPEDRVLNEPDWTRSARYDIQAKVAPEETSKFNRLTNTQRWQMLQQVLEERCG